MWFEALILRNRLAFANGQLVSPLEPVEVKRELRLGARGTPVDLEWELGRTLVITPDGDALTFRWEDSRRSVRLTPGEVWSHEGIAGPSLRVLSTPLSSCGWPTVVPAPLGPWSDALLGVLGDALLEAGAPVGGRLGSREPREDQTWLPLIPMIPPPCIELTWRRGVVDTLTLRTSQALGTRFEVSGADGVALEGQSRVSTLTWALGRALAVYAVCKPMRVLTLRGELHLRNDLLRLWAGLAAGGLPCLESFTCELTAPAGEKFAARDFEEELRTLPGVAAGLPTLRVVKVVR
ncbi:MAG: hypothetical protein Q8L48_09740 [Archangium sp.]|nr:hypothetical protein [Archangium sp.]